MNIPPRLHWFAVRVTYGRELALKAFLDEEKIENFIPMHYEYVKQGDRKIRKLVPVVHNLVFVHSSFVCIDRVKRSLGASLSVRSTRKRIDTLKDKAGMNIPIRYIMNREHHLPVIVPDDQMRSFILVAGTYEESVIYVEPAELQLVRGQKVRVMGGVFEGAVGEFVRIRRDRRVVVNIEGVMAVATTFIHSSLVEPITD